MNHPALFGVKCHQCGWFVAFIDSKDVSEGLLPVNHVWNWLNRGYTVVPLWDPNWSRTAPPCLCSEMYHEHKELLRYGSNPG